MINFLEISSSIRIYRKSMHRNTNQLLGVIHYRQSIYCRHCYHKAHAPHANIISRTYKFNGFAAMSAHYLLTNCHSYHDGSMKWILCLWFAQWHKVKFAALSTKQCQSLFIVDHVKKSFQRKKIFFLLSCN